MYKIYDSLEVLGVPALSVTLSDLVPTHDLLTPNHKFVGDCTIDLILFYISCTGLTVAGVLAELQVDCTHVFPEYLDIAKGRSSHFALGDTNSWANAGRMSLMINKIGTQSAGTYFGKVKTDFSIMPFPSGQNRMRLYNDRADKYTGGDVDVHYKLYSTSQPRPLFKRGQG